MKKDNKSIYLISLEKSARENGIELNENQIAEAKRLNFSSATRSKIAQRVGYKCSFEGCNCQTIGPGDNNDDIVCIGEAAHIVGAINSKNSISPRVDTTMSDDQVKSVENGIWLCRNHHKLVDSLYSTYSIDELRKMKHNKEIEQANLLKESESTFFEKYVFPCIKEEKGIHSNRFTDKDWCLLCFMIDNYDCSLFEFVTEDHSDCFEDQYKNWLSKNSIKLKKSGIRFDSWNEKSQDLRNIVNDLCGLVEMDNECIKQGQEFEKFMNLLYEDNNDNVKLIKESLSTV